MSEIPTIMALRYRGQTLIEALHDAVEAADLRQSRWRAEVTGAIPG